MASDRVLEVKVKSASGLKSVNKLSNMKPYVLVSMVDGGLVKTHQTSIDEQGRQNPSWEARFFFPIGADPNTHHLVFNIKSKSTLGHRDVGHVTVPVEELFGNLDAAAEREVERMVLRPSGKLKGKLKFSYKFLDNTAAPGVGMAQPAYGQPPTEGNPRPGVQVHPRPPRQTFVLKHAAAGATAAAGASMSNALIDAVSGDHDDAPAPDF